MLSVLSGNDGRNRSFSRNTERRGRRRKSNKKDKEKKQKKVNNSSSGNGAGSIGSSDFTFPLTYKDAKYKDVELQCRVKGNRTYIEMQSQAGYELWFTGSSDKNKSYLKVFGKKKIGNSESSKSSWEGEVDKENPYQYIFEFSDKIVTIENGKVVNEEDK